MIKNVDLYDYVVAHGDFRELLILLGRFYADRIESKVLPTSIPKWKDSLSLERVYKSEIVCFIDFGTGTDAANNLEDWLYDICRSYGSKGDAEFRYKSFHEICYKLSVGEFVETYAELVDKKVRKLANRRNVDLDGERKKCLMQMVVNDPCLLD